MITGKFRGTVRQLDNGHFVLTFERTIHLSIDEAWESLVDRKKRSSWFPDVNLSTVTDSSIRIDFGDEGLAIGKVLSVNRPSEFVHTLVWEDMPTTEVSWSFMRVDDDHTMVVLTHQNITSGASVDWAVGWHVILDDLVACVDHKKAPLPDFEELGKYYSKQLAI